MKMRQHDFSEDCDNEETKSPKVFQDLTNATLNMIHEFSNNVIDDTKIIASWNLDREKHLLQWGESNGVKTRVDIAYVEGDGRGGIAREDL
ncbi:hypothetical protein LXL04_012399 [Taraxacum kok-saghyz]